jgi:hypothetical protein
VTLCIGIKPKAKQRAKKSRKKHPQKMLKIKFVRCPATNRNKVFKLCNGKKPAYIVAGLFFLMYAQSKPNC